MTLSPYADQLENELNRIHPKLHNNPESISIIPTDKALDALALLLATTCKSQNTTAINLATNLIKKTPAPWLHKHAEKAIKNEIDLTDEWEYRRLLELLDQTLPHLSQKYAKVGLSLGSDITEAADDWYQRHQQPKNTQNHNARKPLP